MTDESLNRDRSVERDDALLIDCGRRHPSNGTRARATLQQLQEFFVRPAGLFDDGSQRSRFEIAGMKRDRDQVRRRAVIRVGAMLRCPQQPESVSFEDTDHFSGPQGR